MSRFRPGMAATIGGRSCVVLRDVVASKLPPMDDVMVLEQFDGKIIYCALSELKRAREQHPKLPAYGFWQILLCSGLVDKARRIQAVYFDKDDGQYLYQDEASCVFTGEIRNGELIAAAGYTLTSDTAQTVSCDAGNLQLPAQAALSFEERERMHSAGRLRLAVYFSAVAMCMGSALLVYDSKSQRYESGQQAIGEELAAYADLLAERKSRLREVRVGTLPDQRGLVDDLLKLAIVAEDFTLAEASLEDSVFELQTSADAAWLPLVHLTGIDIVEHRRDGSLSLRWGLLQ